MRRSRRRSGALHWRMRDFPISNDPLCVQVQAQERRLALAEAAVAAARLVGGGGGTPSPSRLQQGSSNLRWGLEPAAEGGGSPGGVTAPGSGGGGGGGWSRFGGGGGSGAEGGPLPSPPDAMPLSNKSVVASQLVHNFWSMSYNLARFMLVRGWGLSR